MVFSSITFLMYFLPITLGIYYISPAKLKNTVLFICSLVFYAWGEPVYVSLMLFSTVLDYTCGRMIDKYRGKNTAKLFLLISVFVNLGMLCTFKYSGMLAAGVQKILHYSVHVPAVALPIGISFYTFQTMSYSIDVYRGVIPVQKNIISFGTYVTLFPQLIAGPIVRYETIAGEIDRRKHSTEDFACGAKRFVCGLSKKVLLANNIGLLWESGSKQILNGSGSMVTAWLALIAYGFQIYFDFSGYSDMAIGLGRMFGFHFCENFNYPFLADSITDFWRRWHISMGSWFRDYVYIPLGGSRNGTVRQIINIGIVWLLTGLWHGASVNFILWGIYFGVILMAEKAFILKWLVKIPKVFRRCYSYLIVTISWILFACTKRAERIVFFKALTGIGKKFVCDRESMYLMFSYLPLIAICFVAAAPFGKNIYSIIQKRSETRLTNASVAVFEIMLVTFGMFLSVVYLISSSYNPFLYFRF